MRRDKKRGVYTNRTIKTCPCCYNFCTICKGVCKMDVIADIDPEIIAPNHPTSGRKKKQHHLGVGSFKRGRMFAPVCKHRENSWEFRDIHLERHARKKIIKVQISEQLEFHEIMMIADKSIKS